jgi:hypothetical protein
MPLQNIRVPPSNVVSGLTSFLHTLRTLVEKIDWL